MSNGPSQSQSVPMLGGAVDLDRVKELREPLRGKSYLIEIPQGAANIEHDKRLPPPQLLVVGDKVFLYWMVPAEQVEAADPPFIEPKFIDNSPF